MFESLPQLSLTTREVVSRGVSEFSKLSESEIQKQLDEEISQLEEINQWTAGGVKAVAYCFQQVNESVQHDSDIPQEVKSFWKTFCPFMRIRVLKATLILLRAIDRELWMRDMEAKMKAGEVSQQ